MISSQSTTVLKSAISAADYRTSPFAAFRPFMQEFEIASIACALQLPEPGADVLEWGSGNSTLFFSQFLDGQGSWVSIEHNAEWAECVGRAIDQARLPNLSLHLVPPNGSFRPGVDDGTLASFYDYVTFPGALKKKFGFILVDGRARVACMQKGWPLLADDGIMVLHDAQRPEYAAGFPENAYCLRIEDSSSDKDAGKVSTLFLAKNSDLLLKLRKMVRVNLPAVKFEWFRNAPRQSPLAARPLSFLQVHTFYSMYLDDFYREHPELATLGYRDQINALLHDGFGANHMIAPYLDRLGYRSQLVIANNPHAQAAWLQQERISLKNREHWIHEIVRSQIETMKPEILYLSDPITFGSRFIRSLDFRPPLIVGWRAAVIPPRTDWSEFDLMLSSLTALRELASELGAKATKHFFPGFPVWMNDLSGQVAPEHDVIFTGSWSERQHEARGRLLQSVAANAPGNYSCAFYLSGQTDVLPPEVAGVNLGARFGAEMYRTLKSGRIVLDARASHRYHQEKGNLIDIGGNETANMRIFEVTGCGGFLLTEQFDNLRELFEVGKEIETFRDADELQQKIRYYLAHPEEREAIARRGQERCLRDYNMDNRAEVFDRMVRTRLARKGILGSTPRRDATGLGAGESGRQPSTRRDQERQGSSARTLKVVHLATTDFGGAGKAAYRLHKGLQASGIDSTMLVVNRKNIDPSVRILPSGQLGGVIDCPEEFPANRAYANRVWEHWTAMVSHYPERAPGMEIFSDDFSEIPLECSREIREADIVNLHWVAGLLNCVNAAVALKGKKVVWTMHDMNPLTGGCHYAGECTRYLNSCGSCPMLGSSDEEDISRSIWEFKRYAYGKLDLHPVAPSRWLAGVAARSSLLSPFETRVIPNGFPAQVFTPSPASRREEVRRGYGVPEGAKVVLFGAESLLTERKGFIYLLRALKGMATEGIVFAFFGRLPEEVQLELNLPLINLGFVADEITLAALYSMADLFVIPSIEDNLPNTVVEAMLCGVPVAGFDIGGIPDMVEHKKTGYLVPARDVAALVDGINWCLFHPDAAGLGRSAREKALAHYTLEVQAASYTSLYRELLGAEAGLVADPGENGSSLRSSPPPLTVGGRGEGEAANEVPGGASPPTPSLLRQGGESSVDGAKHRNGLRLVKPAPPRISLVIPSYNYGQYLEACLDSILSQRYHNLELIVMDGGSTDRTPAILERYRKHLSYCQSRPDAGQYSAIEAGLQRSTGEIMGWLNADDMFHPGAFATVSGIFSGHPEIEWLMGRPNSFDEQGRQKVVLSFLPMNSRAKYLADQELIQQEGVFWRRGLWERSGAYIDKELRLAADLELWARFLRSARLFSVDCLIAGFRDHPLQKSKDKAAYTAEANLVLARERRIFAAEAKPFSPPAPLPILVGGGSSVKLNLNLKL